MWLGRFRWKTGDGMVIDGMGPDGVSARVIDVTRGVVRLQTGYVYHYAFAMLIGVAALVSWFTFGGAHRCLAGQYCPSSPLRRSLASPSS
jgi:NADH-quinone oxidoreductase subunit L